MSVDTSGGHPEMDYNEHVRTFNAFIKATTIMTVFTVGVLVFMAIFLV